MSSDQVEAGSRLGLGVIVALIVAALGGSASSSAQGLAHQKDRLDPAACRTDAHGKLYVALGHYVFAVPNDGVTIGGELDSKAGERPFPPPDPGEPEGCPGNPQQWNMYGFMYQYQAAHDEKFGNSSKGRIGVDLVELIDFEWSKDPPNSDRSWTLDLARSWCTKHPSEETISNGLVACGLYPADPRERQKPLRFIGAYMARPGGYTTPLGLPFAVDCVGGLCDVYYFLRPKLALWYRFHPFEEFLHLPVQQVIDFDEGLRASLEASLVADYKWPDRWGGEGSKEIGRVP